MDRLFFVEGWEMGVDAKKPPTIGELYNFFLCNWWFISLIADAFDILPDKSYFSL